MPRPERSLNFRAAKPLWAGPAEGQGLRNEVGGLPPTWCEGGSLERASDDDEGSGDTVIGEAILNPKSD